MVSETEASRTANWARAVLESSELGWDIKEPSAGRVISFNHSDPDVAKAAAELLKADGLIVVYTGGQYAVARTAEEMMKAYREDYALQYGA